MHQHIAYSLDRAEELLRDLLAEYERALTIKTVSMKAIHLTHEVCERLRSILDRTARLYWERHIAPCLNDTDRLRASVYFPITTDQNSFDSLLGRWRWKEVRSQHEDIYQYLVALQPWKTPIFSWLSVINDLAVQSKHIDLVPQIRVEQRTMTVSSDAGTLTIGPGVSFGHGVSLMGAPVDPRTQRIVPTPGVKEGFQIWVNFMIKGHNVNAANLCLTATKGVRAISQEMTARFSLS